MRGARFEDGDGEAEAEAARTACYGDALAGEGEEAKGWEGSGRLVCGLCNMSAGFWVSERPRQCAPSGSPPAMFSSTTGSPALMCWASSFVGWTPAGAPLALLILIFCAVVWIVYESVSDSSVNNNDCLLSVHVSPR